MTTVVVMGVAGSGKSAVGRALARRLGWAFVDADDHHPAANVAKMRAGRPLTDADRAPWLAALHDLVADHHARGEDLVLACSALRRTYRGQLAGSVPDVRLVHLDVPRDVLSARLRERQGHFAGVDLLASQLADLETPVDDEALVVDGTAPVADLVERLAAAL